MVINTALNKVSQSEHLDEANIQYTFCDYLNVSACPATESTKPFTITVYNPIARNVSSNIRIPVSSDSVKIFGPDGKAVAIAIGPISNETKFVRGGLGDAQYELTFPVTNLPPLGVAVYTANITSGRNDEVTTKRYYDLENDHNGDYIIENNHLRLTFDQDTGRLSKIENLQSHKCLAVDQQFLWYNASIGNKESGQASGAYIFRPNSSTPFNVSLHNKATKISVFQNEVMQEIHQVFAPWLTQTVRLYANKPYAEFEYTVGPIKMAPSPELGKEIISRFDTSLKTNGIFYTDANGREMQMRKRNYRPTWTYNSKYIYMGVYMANMGAWFD